MDERKHKRDWLPPEVEILRRPPRLVVVHPIQPVKRIPLELSDKGTAKT